jgi:pSer/pThr/pTyr-binding forkhead associated (FHA) protein
LICFPITSRLIGAMSDVSYNTQSLAALQAISSSPNAASFGHIVLQMKDGSAGPPYPLEERRYLIGRQSYCDIRVQAPTVSREHAQIQVDDNDHVWLVNLSQNNPIKVNGIVHLSRVRLSNGDKFTIGERIFTFERPDTSAVEESISAEVSSKCKSAESKTPFAETKQSQFNPLSTSKFCKSPAVLNFDDCGDKQVIFSPPQPSPHAAKASPHRKLPSAIKNQLQGRIGVSCIMSPKSTKTPLKRERSPFKDLKTNQNDENLFGNQEKEEPSGMPASTQSWHHNSDASVAKKINSNQTPKNELVANESESLSEEGQSHKVEDVVQQLFTLTPAVAANQGVTPKAKSSAKAAGAATPGMDLDTAAAVQQLFTLTPAVAANQGATPKAKSSAKAAGAATPGMDLDTAAAVQQLFTLTPAVAANQRATPKAKSSAKAAGAATPGMDLDTAAAVQQLFTLTPAVAANQGATPKAKSSAKAAGAATPGMDLDTAAAVQQLFTLTPAVAANQGATPKAKSSAKAAGAATPGMDLDTAAAVQQLFTLTPAVAANQGATPKAKSSAKAAGAATPGMDLDTAAAVQQLFTLTPAVAANQRATPKAKSSAKAAGAATPGMDLDTAAAVQQLFTLTPAVAANQGATPKAKSSAKAAGAATPGMDLDTAAAVQQLFTLTPAVAANQGATPKAKSSAKAAGAATPGMDLDTAAAVQQLFTLTPAVAANQGATPKAKSSAKAAGAATPGMDLDTAAAVQQLFTLTPAVAANQGATPKAKSSAKAAGAATPGMDLDTAAAVQQLFTLTPAVAANQGATPKAKSSAKAAGAATPGMDLDTAAAVQQLFTVTPLENGALAVSPVTNSSVHSSVSEFGSPDVVSSFFTSFASPNRILPFAEVSVCPSSKRKSIMKDLTTPSKRKSVCIRPDMNEVALIVDFKVDAPVDIVRTPRVPRKHIDAFRKTKRCRVATPGCIPDSSPSVEASARPQRQSKRQCTLSTPPSQNSLRVSRILLQSPINNDSTTQPATPPMAAASPAKPAPTPVTDAVAAEPEVDLSALKIAELRDMCKSKGLSTSGKKEELVARLSESAVAALEVATEASVTATPAKAAASPAKPAPTPVTDAVAAEPEVDLSALKIAELRDMCKSKGLSTSGKKEELVARLSESAVAALEVATEASVTATPAKAAASPAKPAPTPVTDAVAAEPEVDLSALKIAELRDMCKSKGLSTSGKKEELVARLSESAVAALEVATEASVTATPAKAAASPAKPAPTPVNDAVAAEPEVDLSALKIAELRDMCKSKGLSTSGKKEELVARLSESAVAALEVATEASVTATPAKAAASPAKPAPTPVTDAVAAEPEVDLSALKIAELRDMCKSKGLSTSGKKEELVARLSESAVAALEVATEASVTATPAKAAASPAKPAPTPVTDAVAAEPEVDLSALKIAELRDMCKSKGLSTSGKKEELVARLSESAVAALEVATEASVTATPAKAAASPAKPAPTPVTDAVAAEPEVDLSALKIAELRDMCKSKGLSTSGKKEELVARLSESAVAALEVATEASVTATPAKAAASPAKPAPTPVTDAVAAEPEVDLSALKIAELRDMCKSKGLSTSGKKEELVARLSESAVAALEVATEASVTATPAKAAASPAKPAPTPVTDAVAAEPEVDLSALKIAELRDMCKSKGLSTSGKKEELVARLRFV